MRIFSATMAAIAALGLGSTANAGGGIPFSATGAGGQIQDAFFSTFTLNVGPEVEQVLTLQLDITGLSHTHPDDLKVYLIHPFAGVNIMLEDQGDSFDLDGANLTFLDSASSAAPDEGQILSQAYRPLGLVRGVDGGLGDFVGISGAGTWSLLVIDDSAGDQGRFTSFTVSGTYVPEPMTLSLLAIGAVAAFRRRRLFATA